LSCDRLSQKCWTFADGTFSVACAQDALSFSLSLSSLSLSLSLSLFLSLCLPIHLYAVAIFLLSMRAIEMMERMMVFILLPKARASLSADQILGFFHFGRFEIFGAQNNNFHIPEMRNLLFPNQISFVDEVVS
jgi:hypothetical protein